MQISDEANTICIRIFATESKTRKILLFLILSFHLKKEQIFTCIYYIRSACTLRTNLCRKKISSLSRIVATQRETTLQFSATKHTCSGNKVSRPKCKKTVTSGGVLALKMSYLNAIYLARKPFLNIILRSGMNHVKFGANILHPYIYAIFL